MANDEFDNAQTDKEAHQSFVGEDNVEIEDDDDDEDGEPLNIIEDDEFEDEFVDEDEDEDEIENDTDVNVDDPA